MERHAWLHEFRMVLLMEKNTKDTCKHVNNCIIFSYSITVFNPYLLGTHLTIVGGRYVLMMLIIDLLMFL